MFQIKPLEHCWKVAVVTLKQITHNRCLRVAFRRPSGSQRERLPVVSGLHQASATVTLQKDTLERVKQSRKCGRFRVGKELQKD